MPPRQFLRTGVLVSLTIVASCGEVPPGSEGYTSRKGALSSPGDGDQIIATGWFWEHSSAVVPPGVNASCPNGRMFIADGNIPVVVRAVDLPCVEAGTCNSSAVDANVFSRMTATLSMGPNHKPGIIDGPGTDNQFVVLSDYSLLHVRLGGKLKYGQGFGNAYIFRSTDCGATWSATSIDPDGAFPDGRGGWSAAPTDIGVYRPSTKQFFLDWDGDGAITANDSVAGQPNPTTFDPGVSSTGAVPVMGSWFEESCVDAGLDACDRSRVGLFKSGTWYVDMDGDGQWNASIDKTITFGAAGDTPLVGKWNAPTDNRDLVGTYNAGTVHLDTNGNYKFDGCSVDKCITYGPTSGEAAVVWPSKLSGDQGRRGTLAVYAAGTGAWHLDNGNRVFDGCTVDSCPTFNSGAGNRPVVGVWDGHIANGNPLTWPALGTFNAGVWHLDWNGNSVWDGCTTDKCFTFGHSGDLPVVGKFRRGLQTGGSFDRVEAYADPLDPHGMVYIAMNSNTRQTEATLASSNNFGAAGSWKVLSLWGAGNDKQKGRYSPYTMGSPRSDMLYVFYNWWNTQTNFNLRSPSLLPIAVNTATNTLTIKSNWYVFAESGAFNTEPDTSSFPDALYASALAGAGRPQNAIGIAGIASAGGVDHLYAVYPSARSSTSGDQMLRVMQINVTGGSSISAVNTTELWTAMNLTPQGEAAYPVLETGPPGSLVSTLHYYNLDTDPSSPPCSSADASQCNTYIQSVVMAAEPQNFFSRATGFIKTSEDGNGGLRSWAGYYAPGDYLSANGYRAAPSSDGSPTQAGFVMPWTEMPTGAVEELHTNAFKYNGAIPPENHLFETGDDRWYTDDGDWAVGHIKGECSVASVGFGLSMDTAPTINPHYPRMLHCNFEMLPLRPSAGVTVSFTSADSRRETATGDWDSGYRKGECGSAEAVTGLGHTQGTIDTIRCTPMARGFHRTTCSTRAFPFPSGDNRGTTVYGDWDSGYQKVECGAKEVMKGVSVSTTNGVPHAILCCVASVL